jgi:5-methylcytosine-specific restriction endonuclease McrA
MFAISPLLDAAERSKVAVREFRASVPCPATGKTRGKCKGWQVDHVVPLCAGGPDTPQNMQWLAVEEHKAKTRQDIRYCRLLRRKN